MHSLVTSLPTLDNSAANNFNRCPRLYYLENHEKLIVARNNFDTGELEPAKSAGAAFGDLLHVGLATWYKTFDPVKSCTALLDHPYIETDGDYRTRAKALDLFTRYLSHYQRDPQWEVLFTETPFEVVDLEIDFKWGGKIDLVVRWNDKLWIVDHKSTSVFDKNWWDQFFPDTQTVGYTWAASKLHGEPIYGAIVNMLQVNNNKKEKTNEELFQRRWFVYEPWHIEEFLHQSRRTYSEIGDCINAESSSNDSRIQSFRPRWSACVNKYGRCAWYEHCRLEPSNRSKFLANETLPNTWNFRDI